MRALSPFSPSPSPRSLRNVLRLKIAFAAGVLSFCTSAVVLAAPPTYVGVRSLGMGGALRAAASGDAGPMLNPSGMSLARTYVLEGAYQYIPQADQNVFHGSLVDSASNQMFAAGLSYTYQRIPAGTSAGLRGHDVGLSVSAAAGPRASFGVTAKYLRMTEDGVRKLDALTFDAGATLRPVEGWAVAVVGTNLRNLSTFQAPVTLAGGAAFTGVEGLVLDLDVVFDFGKELPGRGSHTGAMAGVEYLFSQRVAARLGGGYDPVFERGYLTAGLGVFGELGALDAGWRQDISGSGSGRQSYFAIGFRLFVPEPQEGP